MDALSLFPHARVETVKDVEMNSFSSWCRSWLTFGDDAFCFICDELDKGKEESWIAVIDPDPSKVRCVLASSCDYKEKGKIFVQMFELTTTDFTLGKGFDEAEYVNWARKICRLAVFQYLNVSPPELEEDGEEDEEEDRLEDFWDGKTLLKHPQGGVPTIYKSERKRPWSRGKSSPEK